MKVLFFLIISSSIFFIECTEKKEHIDDLCGVAYTEVSKNLLDTLLFEYKIEDSIFQSEMVYVKEKIWLSLSNGIKVYFMEKDISSNTKNRAIQYANLWFNGNAIFQQTDDPYLSDIRVSFRAVNKGYMSLIGSEAQDKPVSEATMWLHMLDNQPDSIFKRVILHEFGHALGLYHELQSPDLKILWDSVVVYRYYMNHKKWTKEQVNKNIFSPVENSKFSKYDIGSIMNYAIPDSFTKNKFSVKQPNHLSSTDKFEIKKLYKL